jgi:hypothetical protein
VTKPGPSVTSGADTQPGSDSLFPSGFGGGSLIRAGGVGTAEIADASIAAADLNLASVAAAIAARSELTGAYARVYGVAATPDGTTVNTAAIQAQLTAARLAGGGVVRVYPAAAAYIIDTPLVIGSNTTLDVTGAMIRLKTGSACNMLVNYAVTQNVRVVDAAMTSGSAVLTSASAVFTSALVGQAVVVQGAGASGAALSTTVASYQSATQVTLAATAGTTVSSRYAAFGPRDSNIEVKGGTWDRQNNAGTNGYDKNSIRIRQVDGIRLYDQTWYSTGGKYSVNVGDVTDYQIARITAANVASDVVHVNGPATKGRIRDITSVYSYDDVVSLTCADFNTGGLDTMQDCVGDISDVIIQNVRKDDATAPFARGVLLLAGQSSDGTQQYTLSNVEVRNVTGSTASAVRLVYVGMDTQDTRTRNGIYRRILIDRVIQEVAGNPAVLVRSDTSSVVDTVEIRSALVASGTATSTVSFDGTPTHNNVTLVGIPRANVSISGTVTNLRYLDANPRFGTLTTAVETMPRIVGLANTATLTSGVLTLTYFQPDIDKLASTVTTYVSSNAASGGTLARIGLYTVDASGNLTLVASMASDTTMWSSTFAGNSKSLSASYQFYAGNTYALGCLFVGTTAPKVCGLPALSGSAMGTFPPRLAGSVASQSDLPSSVANGTVTNNAGIMTYAILS